MKVITAYTVVVLFVVSWWALAFRQPSEKQEGQKNFGKSVTDAKTKLRFSDLTISTIDRSLLRQALAGDFSLMAKFIADWEIDARLLQSIGMDGVKRLPSSDFLRSQVLIRQIANPNSADAKMASEKFLLDAAGKKIDLTRGYHRFLPQTYTAASFLLAIASPEHIVALPKRLREQVQLYPKSLTDRIPLDIERYNGEKLFQAKPEIAFIAHYSHPATVQALQDQGVVLYTMNNLTTLQDIDDELMRIGAIADCKPEAEMLKIFIDAAMLALDNKQLLLIHHFEQNHLPLPKVLVLNFHQNFSAPTKRSLTGQILMRLPLFDITTKNASKHEGTNDWMIPIDKERLISLDPDCLIIATDNDVAVEKQMLNDAALQQLSAVRNRHLYFVDEAIHHSPTHFVVLAYHDLLCALENLP